MKSVSKIVLALAMSVGMIASAAPAHAFNLFGVQINTYAEYPCQKQIEARQIPSYYQLKSAPAMAESAASLDEVVHFDTKTDKPTVASKALIKHVAWKLKSPAYKGAHVTVNGFTDNKGNDAKNQRLSYHRALTVMHSLVAHGVPASMLSAQGFGKENPVASNDTAAGRAANRRVTFTVTTPY